MQKELLVNKLLARVANERTSTDVFKYDDYIEVGYSCTRRRIESMRASTIDDNVVHGYSYNNIVEIF
ncbi:hypothetical protein, partial [Butyrivibrio sp.]|uniref:hypothetical protein n=1 Tax=Butyrivibrio sp. TaxID=28121 RepID=UPI0025B94E85